MSHAGRTPLFGVQAARGVAATMVVVYHAVSLFALEKYGGVDLYGGWGDIGKHGVDFFFVLSGFIIFYAHRADIGKPATFGNYASRRLIRIYPIYWLYLAIFLVLSVASQGFVMEHSGAELLTAVSLVRFTSDPPPLQVAWTLFHEMMFYGLFAVLIFSRRIGIILMVAWAIVMVAMFDAIGPNSPTVLTLFYDLMNVNFLFGMAVALFMRPLSGKASHTAIALGVVSFALVFTCKRYDYFGASVASILYGLSSALVLYGLVCGELSGAIRVGALWRRLGDASFTLYLAHPIILLVLLRIGAGRVADNLVSSHVFVIGISALCLPLSYLLYIWVEKPLLTLFRTGRLPLRQRGAAPT